jgi:PleD family two-component response regulator
LNRADAAAASSIAERILAGFRTADNMETSLSIGIAELQPGMHAATLARAADKALYEAKSRGKNMVHVA